MHVYARPPIFNLFYVAVIATYHLEFKCVEVEAAPIRSRKACSMHEVGTG